MLGFGDSLPWQIKLRVRKHLESRLKTTSIVGLLGKDHTDSSFINFTTVDDQFKSIMYKACGLSASTAASLLAVDLADQISSLVAYSYGAVSYTLPEIALDAAAGANLVYRAVGLLDDIQDNDKTESLVASAGVGVALNIGLLLLTIAHELINEVAGKVSFVATGEGQVSGSNSSSLDPLLLSNHLLHLQTMGFRGQLLDLQEAKLPLASRLSNPDFYLMKNGLKSGLVGGYFIELGVVLGLGGANKTQIIHYRKFGYAFGMAMQLLADLGDFLLAFEKPAEGGRDISQHLPTIPLIYAYQNLAATEKERVLKLWQQENPVPVAEIIDALDKKRGVLLTLGQVARFVTEAEDALKVIEHDEGENSIIKNPYHIAMLDMLHSYVRRLQKHFYLSSLG